MTLRLFFLCTLLTGCGFIRSDYKLTIEFTNGDGLTNYSDVHLNGLSIGKIETVRLGTNNKVLATVDFDQVDKLPIDTEFRIVKDLLGTASIMVKPGTETKLLESGQTIEGIEAERDTADVMEGPSIFKGLLDMPSKQDSILIELRRLNKNIERLIENKK